MPTNATLIRSVFEPYRALRLVTAVRTAANLLDRKSAKANCYGGRISWAFIVWLILHHH